MITNYQPFWLVWCPSGHAPTHKHATKELADREAQRLANANPGEDFIVLQSVTLYRKQTIFTVDLRPKEGPPF